MVQFFQVKVVAKKNMRVLTYADLNLPAGSSQLPDAPSAPSSITREVRRERREDETTGKTYGKWAKIPKAWNRNDMSMSIILFLILHNYIIIVESFVSGQVEFSMIWHFGWNSKKTLLWFSLSSLFPI